MVYALVLSGGTGTRLGGDIPKQYIEVKGKPIIGYCLDTIQGVERIDKIAIVASDEWRQLIVEYTNNNSITKFSAIAPAGDSRQHSILNGLLKLKALGAKNNDFVIIHDAARPCVSSIIINDCLDYLDEYDMSMPVISIKDTAYYSVNGREISSLLNRDMLFAGQAPEGCHFGSYFDINDSLGMEELSTIRGTSALGFQHGLSVGLFPGDELNFKITTMDDLNKFKLLMGETL